MKFRDFYRDDVVAVGSVWWKLDEFASRVDCFLKDKTLESQSLGSIFSSIESRPKVVGVTELLFEEGRERLALLHQAHLYAKLLTRVGLAKEVNGSFVILAVSNLIQERDSGELELRRKGRFKHKAPQIRAVIGAEQIRNQSRI